LLNHDKNFSEAINSLTKSEIQTLKNNGILCESKNKQYEEALDTEKKINRLDKSGNVLSLVIIPTLKCNFKCEYCFEPENVRLKPIMNEEVQENIIKFIEKNIKDYGVRKIKIIWYGGEPLLEKDIIINLQTRINKLCKKYDIDIKNCDLITNGSLLDKRTSNELAKIGMKDIQITIDGLENTHNKRRYYPAEPTNNFKKIIENIKEANEKLRVGVRINIDKNNKDEAYDLVKYLYQVGVWPTNIFRHIYISSTTKSYCDFNNQQESYSFFNRKEFALFNIDFRIWLVNFYNRVSSDKSAMFSFDYPSKFTSGCGYSSHNNSWVISPDGGLHRCWETIGYKRETANMKDVIKNNIDVRTLANKEIPKIKTREAWGCLSCKLFPVCNTLCPYAPYAVEIQRICPDWKFALKEIMKKQYNIYKMNPELVKGFYEKRSHRVGNLESPEDYD